MQKLFFVCLFYLSPLEDLFPVYYNLLNQGNSMVLTG